MPGTFHIIFQGFSLNLSSSDNDLHLLLPHKPPKISDSCWKGT